MIKVDHLSKYFGATRAVDDISFSIRRGEVVGFLGPNGAGKTTTMRLLTHYLFADGGEIRIQDVPLEQDPLAARRLMGYLPESAPLYPDLNVLEYLEFAASIRRIPRKLRKGRVGEMIQACGLGEVLNKSVGVLSKGYRQRVGLAQTMIHDPGILILDEPTTGLDPNQIIEIRELIKALGKEKTIIISTHILPEVQATCSRVMIINQGKIVADDTPGALTDQCQGEQAYQLRIRGDRQQVEAGLEAADEVTRFEFSTQDEEVLTFLVRGRAEGDDLGEKLFRMAVDQGFTLVEMRRESVSLEHVFASLTRGEEAP